MSLNHILYDTVPDDEKCNVKFKNVYCDQVITGSGPGPGPVSGDGYIDAQTGAVVSSPTTGISITTSLPSYTTGIKNHSTFIWSFKSEIQLLANLTNYSLDVRIPDSIKTYFDANPTAFATYFISVNGASNSINSTATFNANMMYYANEAVKHSADTVRITMLSGSGNGTGPIPDIQNVNLQIIFSGPAN